MNIHFLAGLAAAAILASTVGATASAAAESQAVELTAGDITQDPDFTSLDCTVFGLRLGMPKAAVLQRLEEKNFLWGYYNGYLLTEKKFSDIIYVFDRLSSEAVGGSLMRLNFDAEGKLTTITLYPAMDKYLVGQSKRLVDQEVLEPSVRTSLLGKPNQVESQELPIIDLKLDIFHYPNRGLQIRHKHSYSKRTDEVYFSLLPPRAP